MSRYEKTIGHHEQALAIAREIRERNREGEALDGLGNAYSRLLQYEKAPGYYDQTLA